MVRVLKIKSLATVRYFIQVGPPPSVASIRSKLWTDQGSEVGSTTYSSALLEQYKIYVEMADRVSSRRSQANTFFLTLNSSIFTLIGALLALGGTKFSWILVFPTTVLVAQCLAWYWLVRSYRQLNAAKYAVVGAMEERLPASPYWRAEWAALGEGRDPSRYIPLTHLEQWIPMLFALSYLGAFFGLLFR